MKNMINENVNLFLLLKLYSNEFYLFVYDINISFSRKLGSYLEETSVFIK